MRSFRRVACTLLALLASTAWARQPKAPAGGPTISVPAAVIPTDAFRTSDAAPLTNATLAGGALVGLHPSFWTLVEPGAQVEVLAQRNYSFAHEAPVWLPETRQLFFVSNRLTSASTGGPEVQLFLLSLDSGEVQQLEPSPPILMANGGTPFGPGKVVVTSQGLEGAPGGLTVLDVRTQRSTPLVNNWAGLAFNSPNDVAVHAPSGALLFTDPAYGHAQGFRPAPQVGNWVWRFDPATNGTTPLADAFLRPNGVVFSPDFKTAYVSDTGAIDGTGSPASFMQAAPAIHAFDVALDAAGLPTLRNRRLFGVCATGIPDGLKVDREGNLFAGVPGGVDVFSPSGQLLGSVAVGPVANLAFAGRTLVMLQEGRVTALKMRARGVRLPLQAAG